MSSSPTGRSPTWHSVQDASADPQDGGHRYRRVVVGAASEAGVPVAWPGAHGFDRPAPPTPPGTAVHAAEAFAPEARAPMAAKVLAVHVAAGHRVAPGALLVVLEAMKMEHRLTAPDHARVLRVAVKPGQQVAHGAVLVTLEPLDG